MHMCPGHPAVLRYWQESSVTADWLKPDESSSQTVVMTAYILLTVLLKVLLLDSVLGFFCHYISVVPVLVYRGQCNVYQH